jgi:hypothetical protein
VDIEEETLFESMKGNYHRSVSPRSRREYYAFMTAWNLEVANRLRQKIQDDNEDVIVINRKSIQQLQEHYDRVEARLAASGRAEEEHVNEASFLDDLNNTLRENSQRLEPLPPIQEATCTVYPQEGQMPVGNPMVMNAEILAGTLRICPPTECNPIPFIVLPPNPAQAAANPLQHYKRTKWCITCGYQKADHKAG